MIATEKKNNNTPIIFKVNLIQTKNMAEIKFKFEVKNMTRK